MSPFKRPVTGVDLKKDNKYICIYIYIYIYIYVYMVFIVFTTEGFLEVAI